MFTFPTRNHMLAGVLASLTIGVTVVVGVMLNAAAHTHAYL